MNGVEGWGAQCIQIEILMKWNPFFPLVTSTTIVVPGTIDGTANTSSQYLVVVFFLCKIFIGCDEFDLHRRTGS